MVSSRVDPTLSNLFTFISFKLCGISLWNNNSDRLKIFLTSSQIFYIIASFIFTQLQFFYKVFYTSNLNTLEILSSFFFYFLKWDQRVKFCIQNDHEHVLLVRCGKSLNISRKVLFGLVLDIGKCWNNWFLFYFCIFSNWSKLL